MVAINGTLHLARRFMRLVLWDGHPTWGATLMMSPSGVIDAYISKRRYVAISTHTFWALGPFQDP